MRCPDCGKSIGIDEDGCPDCRTKPPESWIKSDIWPQVLKKPERLVRAILFLNVGVYVFSLLLNPRAIGLSSNPFNLLSPHYQVLQLIGFTGTTPINMGHKWWSVLSASYFHGGIFHLLINMLVFRLLAPLIAREYGIYRMVILYTMGGILGYLVSYLAGVEFTLGASAAIFGLIGALLYFGKSRGGEYGKSIYRQVGGWALMFIIIGFLVPTIDNWAHGGGLLSGYLLGFFLGCGKKKRETKAHKFLAFVFLSGTLLVLIWTMLLGTFMKI